MIKKHLSGGIVYNFVNRQIIVVFLLAASSTCLFVFPHVNSLGLFFALAGIMGIGGGGFDTAQVAWIIDIWRHEAGPFILSQHFAYAVGTLVPPLLFAPFLTGDLPTTPEPESATEGAAVSSSTDQSTTSALAPSAELFIPFTVSGCLGVLAVLVQIVLYIVFQRMKDPQANTNNSNNNEERGGKDSNFEKKSQTEDLEIVAQKTSLLRRLITQVRLQRRKLLIVFLGCCFIGFYQAMEQCTMLFLPTFGKRTIGLSDKDGANVLFGLNVGFAAGRAVGIVTVLKILPQYILAANFTLVLIGNTLLLTAGSSSLTWMWVGSICLGLGFSTLYPAFYAYLEKHLFVNDSIAATITVSGGLVSSLYPLIVKKYVEDNPKILNYMDYVSFAVSMIAFIVVFRLTRSKNKNDDIKEQQD